MASPAPWQGSNSSGARRRLQPRRCSERRCRVEKSKCSSEYWCEQTQVRPTLQSGAVCSTAGTAAGARDRDGSSTAPGLGVVVMVAEDTGLGRVQRACSWPKLPRRKNAMVDPQWGTTAAEYASAGWALWAYQVPCSHAVRVAVCQMRLAATS